MMGVPELYLAVTKPIPWSNGKVIVGVVPPGASKLTLTENASRVSVVRVVPVESSAADMTRDWMPSGAAKYDHSPASLLCFGPLVSCTRSMCDAAMPQLAVWPEPFDQLREYG